MFLNEPHRTTRNFKALKSKLGKDIFAKDQRMEPYYASALALYKLEYSFRTKRLEAKYKAARFHILLALRLLISGYEMPDIRANKMEEYCKTLTAALLDQEVSAREIERAAKIIDEASAGNFDRDVIRTEPFTESVIKLAN